MRTSLTAPWRYLLLVCSLWFGIFLLTRLILLATHLDEVHGDYISLLFSGALYDLSLAVSVTKCNTRGKVLHDYSLHPLDHR
ncbi:hypothetical protein, partial [Pseudomonas sp. NMI542_15]|uniref:hypothetical protein n=1 Tax=Pseudomonas sp. NMI542_15 TaxID=2903148 RepID=UPI001E3D0DCB